MLTCTPQMGPRAQMNKKGYQMDPNGPQIIIIIKGPKCAPTKWDPNGAPTRPPNGSQGPWTSDVPNLDQGNVHPGPGTRPILEQARGQSWTRDGAYPRPGTGLNLDHRITSLRKLSNRIQVLLRSRPGRALEGPGSFQCLPGCGF